MKITVNKNKFAQIAKREDLIKITSYSNDLFDYPPFKDDYAFTFFYILKIQPGFFKEYFDFFKEYEELFDGTKEDIKDDHYDTFYVFPENTDLLCLGWNILHEFLGYLITKEFAEIKDGYYWPCNSQEDVYINGILESGKDGFIEFEDGEGMFISPIVFLEHLLGEIYYVSEEDFRS